MATTEFKAGLFVLASVGIIIFGVRWSVDGVKKDETQYTLHLPVASADGIYEGTDVDMAGVPIGSTSLPIVAGDGALVDLHVRSTYKIPIDSTATMPSSGVLGARYVLIHYGDNQTQFMKDGDTIRLLKEPVDIDKIESQVSDIADDIKAITGVLRKMAEDDHNRENVAATLANVNALTAQVKEMTEENHQDVRAIVENLKTLTANLNDLTKDTQGNLDTEMKKLQDSTDTLQATLDNMKSVTGKIDKGKGTIGALINDEETVNNLNDTITSVKDLVKSVSSTRTEVYYTGRYYIGSAPCPAGNSLAACANGNPFFYGNPLASTASNTIGLRFRSQEDFGYVFEIDDAPQGTISSTEHYFPETGQHYTEWQRKDNYRFTFEMEKRWMTKGAFSFALRLGVKEDGGGVGASVFCCGNGKGKDKVELQTDAFDFSVGSYPALASAGTPDIRTLVRISPVPHVYVEFGNEQPILGIKYGYFSGFIGAGFHFDDDSVRWLFATLPLNF